MLESAMDDPFDASQAGQLRRLHDQFAPFPKASMCGIVIRMVPICTGHARSENGILIGYCSKMHHFLEK